MDVSRARISLISILLLTFAGGGLAAQQAGNPQPGFGGTYATLTSEQRRLVDDWVRRFTAVTRRRVDAATGYDNLPLSTRTTFNAVTHALMRTPLTDSDGRSLGDSALSLVQSLDAVNGRVAGARGDEQFRVYVQLTPDALDRLQRAKEFGRGPDNTVYHKGYPICFRSRGGTPSIQVSISREGSVADIDVDYRSSKFPMMLVNGHLASANSDVRAGNNDERHNNQWTGLDNWWRNLLGLLSASDALEPSASPIPQTPTIRKDARPEEAVRTFLDTWIVQRKPAEVVPTFADDTLACMELQSGKAVDRGMVRFAIMDALMKAREPLGEVTGIDDVMEGVEMPGTRTRLRAHRDQRAFVLYDLREDLAEQLKCTNRLDPQSVSEKTLRSTKFGKYAGSIFRLKAGPMAGQTTALLWEKRGGYWQIIAYTTEPQVEIARSMNLVNNRPPAPTLPLVDGDPALVRAVHDFHTQWFVRRDVAKALEHMAPRSLACVNGYLDDGVPPAGTVDEQRRYLRVGMERALAAAEGARSLHEAIAAPEVNHPDLKLVRHRDTSAFALAALPDSLLGPADCTNATPGELNLNWKPPTGPPAYGTYFGSGFRMANAVDDPAVIWLLWAKDGADWKVVGFSILTS